VPVDTSWTFNPVVLVALAGYGAVYTARWRTAREEGGARAAGFGRLALWWSGLLALFVALISPLDRLGEQFASAHMVQHLLLADVAAICLILATTRHILRPVTRRLQWLEERAHPILGVIAYVGAMWLWHVPSLYEAALESDLVHALEHLTYAGAGLVYWWFLLSPMRTRLAPGGLAPVFYMFGSKILVGFLGLLLTFSPDLFIDAYAGPGERWGLTPLDDQHVSGLIMALEQSLIMGIVLAWLFMRMLNASDKEDERAERYA
jgi:cytochrome c oxidase assembly factor CtaG